MPESFARLLCPALRFLFGFPSRALICRQTNGIRNRVGGYGVEAPLLIKHGFAGKPKCGRTNLRSGLSALLHAFFGKGKTKGIAVRFEKTVIGGETSSGKVKEMTRVPFTYWRFHCAAAV